MSRVYYFIPYAFARVGISLTPQAFQIAIPSEPISQRTRLFTSSSIRLKSFTSISGVLSVTVISPPFRLRWLNLHQNCLVDLIFILYTKSICSVITIRPPVFQCLINPTMSSSYLITCSANPIDPSEHS